MLRLKTGSWSLAALILCAAASLHALGRLKIQVVQTHTGIKMGVGYLAGPGTSKVAATNCTGLSGTYSSEYGYHCPGADFPDSSEGGDSALGYEFFFDFNAIMPDGSRLLLHCSKVLDKHCAAIPSYLDNTSIVCTAFAMEGAHYKDCTAHGTSEDGVGVYEAETHGDRVTIYGKNWNREYLRYGTWQIGNPESADRSFASTEHSSPEFTALAAGNHISIDPGLLTEAIEGDPVAQYKVGYDYFLGRGVAQDYKQAAAWWRKAAEQGYASSQNNLGVLYKNGQGVPQSYGEAYFWENLAATRMDGPLQAQFATNRDDAASHLPLVERLREQERASQWLADHQFGADKDIHK